MYSIIFYHFVLFVIFFENQTVIKLTIKQVGNYSLL